MIRLKPINNKKVWFLLGVTTFALVAPLTYDLPSNVNAADLTSRKVTISDSRAGVSAQHTFDFTKGASSTTAIKTVLFQYCTESTSSGTCTAPTGMALAASITVGTVTGIAGSGSGVSAAGSDSTCNGTGNTDCNIVLTITTPSAETGGSTTTVPFTAGITNPTTTDTSFYVRITTRSAVPATIDGPSVVAFGILTSTSIAVSASVDSTFAFTVAGVASGGNIGGDTTDVPTTANTIPFGTLVAGTEKQAATDATIATNGNGGYQLTVKALATPPLVGANNGSNNIDSFSAGTNSAPASWTAPAGASPSVDTGFFGYTTNDTTLSNTGNGTNRFTGATLYAGTTTTAAEVGYSTSATGSGGDTIRVGWQAEVNSIQPNDTYSGTVVLVATPTY